MTRESGENMTSRVTVKATLDEMDELFNDTQSGFSIRCCDRKERIGENGIFKVVVRHGDDIGYQDGKIFDCKTFREKFEDAEYKKFCSEVSENKISLLETDLDIAQRGIEGGMSAKTVGEILKIYGTNRCRDEKYIKEILKLEKVRSAMKKNQAKQTTLNFGR